MKHGGKRKNSGRKKKYPTKVIRIPVAINDKVEELKFSYDIQFYANAIKKICYKTIHPTPNGN